MKIVTISIKIKTLSEPHLNSFDEIPVERLEYLRPVPLLLRPTAARSAPQAVGTADRVVQPTAHAAAGKLARAATAPHSSRRTASSSSRRWRLQGVTSSLAYLVRILDDVRRRFAARGWLGGGDRGRGRYLGLDRLQRFLQRLRLVVARGGGGSVAYSGKIVADSGDHSGAKSDRWVGRW